MTPHPACPLTDATAPLYAALDALRWQDEPDPAKRLAIRQERAKITGKLWQIVRNGNHQKKEQQ